MHDPGFDERIAAAARVVWNWLCLRHDLKPASAILCLGSFDPSAARFATQLYQQHWAPRLIFSGGIAHRNDLGSTGWDKPEAEVFAAIAESEGVPKSAIILESASTNTGENFAFTRGELVRLGVKAHRLILVTKPYMTRRAAATAAVVWPSVEWIVQHEPISFDDYLSRCGDVERVLQVMVGDMHRMLIYPYLGFQSVQEVPADTLSAFRYLAANGYNRHLVTGYDPSSDQLAAPRWQ